MATKTDSTRLDIAARETANSRETRRLRRSGRVPGVLYGRGQDPVSFSVDARELRHALARTGAVVELSMGDKSTPAVLKDTHKHPVRGEFIHVDFLRVDLNKPIAATVVIEVVGADDAPGVKEGGIIDQVTREVNIEALPSDIPETIELDVSEAVVGDTIFLSALKVPAGVTLTDDLEETVLVSVAAPTVVEETEGDEVETETEVVGEGDAAEGDASEESGDDAGSDGDDAGE